MWLDGFQWDKAEQRLSEWRAREAVAAQPVSDFISTIVEVKKTRGNGRDESLPIVRILAVACPYEKPRFEDATKTIEEAKSLIVKDIAELLAESMGLM